MMLRKVTSIDHIFKLCFDINIDKLGIICNRKNIVTVQMRWRAFIYSKTLEVVQGQSRQFTSVIQISDEIQLFSLSR